MRGRLLRSRCWRGDWRRNGGRRFAQHEGDRLAETGTCTEVDTVSSAASGSARLIPAGHERPTGASSGRSATGSGGSTGAPCCARTARRSTSSCSPSSPRTRTTATATWPTSGCASASPRGTRCATRPWRRSRRRSAPAASRRRRRCASSRSSARSATTTSPGSRTRRSRRRATTCATCPGVGRKTAACVLLFSYGRPDVPVDTHVYRVGTRLGLWPEGASLERAARRACCARGPRRTPTRSTCS